MSFTGLKTITHLTIEKDIDSVSVNSTISANSDSSEVSSSFTKQPDELFDQGAELYEVSAADKPIAKSEETIDEAREKSEQNTDITDNAPDEIQNTKPSELSGDENNGTEPDEKKNTGTEIQDHVNTGMPDVSGKKNEQNVNKSGKDETEAIQVKSLEKVNDRAETNVPVGETYHMFDVQQDRSDVSNLDVEISKLNSYLSDTSDRKYTEGADFQENCDAAERVLLKDTKMHGLTEDRNKYYAPSNLEKELAELEKSSLLESSEDNSKSGSQRKFSDSYVPSIYTIYNKPGAQNDDFYSQFMPKSPSAMSSLMSNSSLSDVKNDFEDNSGVSELIPASAFPNFIKAVNTWTEIELHGNLYSLSVSSTHVWVTDRSTNIYYSALSGPGLLWKKVSGYASQISVSKDGNIVWALNKGTVSAGTKITAKRPEGMKWVEAVRDVAYMCVDETCAWYV